MTGDAICTAGYARPEVADEAEEDDRDPHIAGRVLQIGNLNKCRKKMS